MNNIKLIKFNILYTLYILIIYLIKLNKLLIEEIIFKGF